MRCRSTGISREGAGATSSRRRRPSGSRCPPPVRSQGRPQRGRASVRPRPSAVAVRGRHAPVRQGPVRNRREGRHRQAAEAVRGEDRNQGPAHDRAVERRGCDVRDELRGAEPVRRQLPDEHRPDGPRDEGRPRGAEHTKWLYSPAFASTGRSSSRTRSRRARIRASSTACRASSAARSCYYNKDLLAKAGVTKIPTNTAELAAAGRQGKASDSEHLGLHRSR